MGKPPAEETTSQPSYEQLVVQNQELLSRLHKSETTVALDKVGAVLPKPSTFSGTSDVDDWLFKAFQYVSELPTSEAGKVRIAGSFLEGSALLWWRRAHEDAPSKEEFPYRTWPAFRDALRELFRPINNVRQARDQLATLQQTTSVQEYVRQFRFVCLQIPGIAIEEMMDRFIRGLKPRIREIVITSDTSTLEEVMSLAERQDANLEWNRRLPSRPPPPQPHQARHFQPRQPQYHHHQQQRPAPFRPAAQNGPIPMELDAVHLNPLTPQEREYLRLNRGCYKCRKLGHFSYQCMLGSGNVRRQ